MRYVRFMHMLSLIPQVWATSISTATVIGAGVKIVFNYSEALLDVPSDVNVHTSNPAVALLYALYFHLT